MFQGGDRLLQGPCGGFDSLGFHINAPLICNRVGGLQTRGLPGVNGAAELGAMGRGHRLVKLTAKILISLSFQTLRNYSPKSL